MLYIRYNPPGITSPSELDATTPISYACTQCGALIDEIAPLIRYSLRKIRE